MAGISPGMSPGMSPQMSPVACHLATSKVILSVAPNVRVFASNPNPRMLLLVNSPGGCKETLNGCAASNLIPSRYSVCRLPIFACGIGSSRVVD